MARRSSRSREANSHLRTFRDAERAETLLQALNGEGDWKGIDTSGLADFVKLLCELQDDFRLKRITPRDPGLRNIRKKIDSINKRLGGYQAVPVVYLSLALLDYDWRLMWKAAASHSIDSPLNQELGLVLQVLDLAKTDLILALKKCPSCRRWLFARFSHQRFCSDRCRDEFHHTDPEEKQRRREWARGYYQVQKKALGSQKTIGRSKPQKERR